MEKGAQRAPFILKLSINKLYALTGESQKIVDISPGILTITGVLRCNIPTHHRSERSYDMFAVSEDFGAVQKASVDHLLKFADAATQATEQWLDLNIKSAKAATAEVTKQMRALATAKDVQELTSLQTTFAQDNADKVLGYSKAVFAWASETQGQVSKLVEEQFGEVNKAVSTAVEKAAKSAPAGSEFAFSAVKSALATANQAYETMSKAGKQVAEMTEQSINTAANTITTPRKKAA